MYEKIVRGLVSVDSQTPYNPASNFGKGTIGNFRAVAFSSAVVLTPPGISASGQNEQIVLSFPLNQFFTQYNLYWSTSPGVTKESNVISDLQFSSSGKENANYTHKNLTTGAIYYYRMEVEDAEGNVSILSPEVSPDDGSTPDGNAPSNVTATAGAGKITISWNAVNGAEGYVIFWDTTPGFTGGNKLYDTKNRLTSPYTHTGLDKGVTYYYKVCAYFGSEVYLSAEVSATPH